MSLYSAKINSTDHNCLMMLVNTELVWHSLILSAERAGERDGETQHGLEETGLCINIDLKNRHYLPIWPDYPSSFYVTE